MRLPHAEVSAPAALRAPPGRVAATPGRLRHAQPRACRWQRRAVRCGARVCAKLQCMACTHFKQRSAQIWGAGGVQQQRQRTSAVLRCVCVCGSAVGRVGAAEIACTCEPAREVRHCAVCRPRLRVHRPLEPPSCAQDDCSVCGSSGEAAGAHAVVGGGRWHGASRRVSDRARRRAACSRGRAGEPQACRTRRRVTAGGMNAAGGGGGGGRRKVAGANGGPNQADAHQQRLPSSRSPGALPSNTATHSVRT